MLLKRQAAIAVFDSGMGGLTVLRALRQLLPHESFLYLGDTARLPYGTKSVTTIQHYALQVAKLLINCDIKCLVIACNTASMAALAFLQQQFPRLPIIGVIEPGASAAVAASQSQAVIVAATETTIYSDVYPLRLKQLCPTMRIASVACNLWVALTEAGCYDDALAKLAIAYYLDPILATKQHYDCLLLGCTHFPLMKRAIKAYVGSSLSIVDSAVTTALSTKQILQQANLLQTLPEAGRCQFMVTDSPARFSRIGQSFLGEVIDPTMVSLVDVS